jgi:hypothetical protein
MYVTAVLNMKDKSLNVRNVMAFYGDVNVKNNGNPSFVSRTKLPCYSHVRLNGFTYLVKNKAW